MLSDCLIPEEVAIVVVCALSGRVDSATHHEHRADQEGGKIDRGRLREEEFKRGIVRTVLGQCYMQALRAHASAPGWKAERWDTSGRVRDRTWTNAQKQKRRVSKRKECGVCTQARGTLEEDVFCQRRHPVRAQNIFQNISQNLSHNRAPCCHAS